MFKKKANKQARFVSPEERQQRRIRRYFIHHKGAVLLVIAAFIFLSAFTIWQLFRVLPVSGYYSDSYLQSIAGKYIKGSEKTATPIIINHGGKDYYYVPFEINGKIENHFPGFMLDEDAKPVTNKNILKELFRYPGLLKESASTRSGFNSVAYTRAKAVSQYCSIVNTEEDQLRKTVASGEIGLLLYHGAKLAFGAVGLVHNAIEGLRALMVDLAKGQVQDLVVDLFVPKDARAALDSAYRAHAAARQTTTYCLKALEAWRSMQTTSGSITPEKAKNATESLYLMFGSEASSMKSLRDALKKIDSYPRVISGIGADDYKKGMAGFDNLIVQLDKERSDWQLAHQISTKSLDLWTGEQVSRAAVPASVSSCHKDKKNGDSGYCLSSCPCDAGQGVCSRDSDCKSGLKCAKNVGAKYGASKYKNYCERK